MIVDTIRKTHPKGNQNGSLGILISAIELVAIYVPAKTRDLLTTKLMSDKSRPMNTQ
jgi:histidinol dehydrogenase